MVAAEELDVGWGDILEPLVVAHLSDCTGLSALVVGPVLITSIGIVSAAGAEPVLPPGLDPCRPFYVRIGDEVKVWQATQRERDEGDLVFETPPWLSNRLTIMGVGTDSADSVLIDAIDFEIQWWAFG